MNHLQASPSVSGLMRLLVDSVARVPDFVWAALVSALATLALAAVFSPRRPYISTLAPQSPASTSGTACSFLIHDGRLQAASEPARALLDTLAPASSSLAALTDHLATDCATIRQDLETLMQNGVPFRRHCSHEDGTLFEVTGEPRGGAVFVSVHAAGEDARALRDAREALERRSAEAEFLREALDGAPVLTWSFKPDGQLTWANAAYRATFDVPTTDLPDHRLPKAFEHVLEEVPLTARAGGNRRRVSVTGGQNGNPRWFEVLESPGPGGETLGFALSADDLVAAEASLRRFVETLTETFAHLPIGLAVFDKNRCLGLFNPALTKLVKIDAVWLAGRPTLRDFLERLRETRQMPEQKDFASWRRKLTELEEGARDGTYEENWLLPSGKVFRVSGRPHPQGAIAFLFEDISTAISLERRYRSELELSQATLDRLSEAVAVFDASGMLVFANAAFEKLWGLDPMKRLEGPGVSEMTQRWRGLCTPSDVWDRLTAFATGGEARRSWTAGLETLDRRKLHMLVAPLPDASALVVFRDLSAEATDAYASAAESEALQTVRERDADISALALEQIHVPVEAAVRALGTAIPAAASPEAFQTLSRAAQALTDGLARSRELQQLARPDAQKDAAPNTISRLRGALGLRGMSLELAPEPAIDDPALCRAVWALTLAAADLAAPGAAITVAHSIADGDDLDATAPAYRISVGAPAGPQVERSEPVSLALARRVLEGVGGGLIVMTDLDGTRVTLTGEGGRRGIATRRDDGGSGTAEVA